MIPSDKLMSEYNRAQNTGGNWRSARRFGSGSPVAPAAKSDTITPPKIINTLLEKAKPCPRTQQL